MTTMNTRQIAEKIIRESVCNHGPGSECSEYHEEDITSRIKDALDKEYSELRAEIEGKQQVIDELITAAKAHEDTAFRLTNADLASRASAAAAVEGDAPSLQRRLYDECVTANWDPEKRNTFAEEIAHLHEELSEAFRAWRKYKDCEIRQVNGKLEGVPIEFADALIGMFYNAELHGFDLLAAIETKHQFNLARNYINEGRQLHPPAAASSPPPAEPPLDCPMCNAPKSFTIDANDPALGYCRVEKTSWRITDNKCSTTGCYRPKATFGDLCIDCLRKAVDEEGLTPLQKAVVDHDDDMARIDRNTLTAPAQPEGEQEEQ